MLHLLPCLTTFNIVGYINETKLNNLNVVFRQYATELHIELHLICSIVCCTLPCHASLNRTCIILDYASCHDYACVFTALFASFQLLLSLASVSFWSCEDSFDYVRLSSSWTRSSSLRDLRQDDHTLDITSIFALLVVRSIAMLALPTTCLSSLPNCHASL